MTQPRHIVVDATPYGPEPSGARRRCESLLRHLAAMCPDDVFEVHWAADTGVPREGMSLDNVVHVEQPVSCGGGWRRLRARHRQLRQRHRHAAYTHLLVDYAPVPVLPGVRTLVTIHDLRFLHGLSSRRRALYGRLRYGVLLRRAAAVVVVAPSLARACQAQYGLLADRVHTIPNAVSASFQPPAASTSRQGALVVARDLPYKARGAAQAAAREAGLALEIVEGATTESELVSAYQRACWLLAPSLYEGFHLPVIEALACHTPVIASDIDAHRDLETLGAGGIVRVPPPTHAEGRWSWPEAVHALAAPPPAQVLAPSWTWADAAHSLSVLLTT